jgi:hypothetical protein
MIFRATRCVTRCGFRAILFVVALASGALLANAVFTEGVTGSGTPATEDRPISNATEVVISGSSDVELIRGDMPGVRVTADDNILPLLETISQNGKLTFQTKSGFNIHPVTPIKYVVTLPGLEKLTLSGTGNVRAAGLAGDSITVKLSGAGKATLDNIACKTFNLTLSGVGSARLMGQVEKLVVKVSGAGNIDARDLKAKSAETQISGAGGAKVWATQDLKVKVSGAGHIQYKGNPQLEQKISGAGSVKQIE